MKHNYIFAILISIRLLIAAFDFVNQNWCLDEWSYNYRPNSEVKPLTVLSAKLPSTDPATEVNVVYEGPTSLVAQAAGQNKDRVIDWIEFSLTDDFRIDTFTYGGLHTFWGGDDIISNLFGNIFSLLKKWFDELRIKLLISIELRLVFFLSLYLLSNFLLPKRWKKSGSLTVIGLRVSIVLTICGLVCGLI